MPKLPNVKIIVLDTLHWRRFNYVQNLIVFCATRWHIWGIRFLGGEEEVYVVAASTYSLCLQWIVLFRVNLKLLH